MLPSCSSILTVGPILRLSKLLRPLIRRKDCYYLTRGLTTILGILGVGAYSLRVIIDIAGMSVSLGVEMRSKSDRSRS